MVPYVFTVVQVENSIFAPATVLSLSLPSGSLTSLQAELNNWANHPTVKQCPYLEIFIRPF